jgi:hypothetical protein
MSQECGKPSGFPHSPPWWKQFPKRESRWPRAPGPDDRPVFRVGDLVRLKGKPERARRVLDVVWHRHRYQYVYIVETSAPGFEPYWFAEQLLPVEEG